MDRAVAAADRYHNSYNHYDPATWPSELADLFNNALVLAPNTLIDVRHTGNL